VTGETICNGGLIILIMKSCSGISQTRHKTSESNDSSLQGSASPYCNITQSSGQNEQMIRQLLRLLIWLTHDLSSNYFITQSSGQNEQMIRFVRGRSNSCLRVTKLIEETNMAMVNWNSWHSTVQASARRRGRNKELMKNGRKKLNRMNKHLKTTIVSPSDL
jgi:hypothetical protein